MLRNIEHIERNQTHPTLLLDVCRRTPDTFISIADLQSTFGWSHASAWTTVTEARKRLKADALYTVNLEEGIVYKQTRCPIGERIVPSGFRPDPTWLSEFPQRRDLGSLLKRVRFAVVESETSATPLLTPGEHMVLIRLVADMASQQVSPMDELSRFVPKLARKLTAETRGEWVIGSERRSGLCYMLKHNGV
ncbi:MAG: hypothetical protein NTY06_04515 [Candidatus Gottesmanbacteria bacterium]|nr:hypothetical protein [Candidatus Gottesmanbacteria bacterium]